MATMHAALPQTAQDMYERLQLVNLESVRAQAGATKPDMDDYRRFLALKAAAEKLNPIGFAHCLFSPTPEMDQVWHAHILDTRLYMEACAAMGAKDAFVHHDPHGGDDPDVQRARRAFTKAAFTKCYDGLPASKWPPTAMEIIEGAGLHTDDEEEDDSDDEGPVRPAKRPRPRSDDAIMIFVKTMDGRTITLRALSKDTTVKAVKALLHAAGEAPPEEQRIVFAGKQLEDDRTMDDYNIQALSTLYMTMRLRGC